MQSTLFPLQGHFGENVASPSWIGGGVVIGNGLDSRSSFSSLPYFLFFFLALYLSRLSAFFGSIAFRFNCTVAGAFFIPFSSLFLSYTNKYAITVVLALQSIFLLQGNYTLPWGCWPTLFPSPMSCQ